MLRFLFVVLAALAASPCLAQELPSHAPDALPFEAVSAPGEPLDAFVLRVAPTLMAFTAASGFEACGVIAHDTKSGRFGVRVGSSKGTMTCGMSRSNVPTGFVATDLTLHSHPERRTVLPTAADVAYFEVHPIGDRIVKRGRPESLGNSVFSTADYRAGPGYLVRQGQLWFQTGPGTDRMVGSLSE